MLELHKQLCWKRTLGYMKRLLPVLCCLALFTIYTTNRLNKVDVKSRHPWIYNFTYRIYNDICSTKPYLLILVHSAANHFEYRNVIRKTIGRPGWGLSDIKVAFLLAISEEFHPQIDAENAFHRDIIQGNFIDSYRNLTYKHTMALSWAYSHCNGTRYIMKMDDDIFVDIYQLMDYIKTRVVNLDLSNNIACYFQKSMPVVRDPVSKWFVPKDEFPSDTFDDYCSGWAYLTTPQVAGLLSVAVRKLPYFWVDDVHLTGMAASVANIGRIRLNRLYALETDGLVEWVNSSTKRRWNKVFAPTWGDLALSRRAHKKAKLCYETNCECCFERTTTPKPITKSTTIKGVAQVILLH